MALPPPVAVHLLIVPYNQGIYFFGGTMVLILTAIFIAVFAALAVVLVVWPSRRSTAVQETAVEADDMWDAIR
jgi:hypothetical protein